MVLPPIVQGLPFVAWIILAALAFGSFAFVALTRQLTDATRGYLTTTTVFAALLALLALAVDNGLTAPADLVIGSASADIDLLRRVGLIAFALLAFAYVFALRGRLPVLPVALVTLGAALIVLAAAAFGWAPSAVDGVPLAVQLVALSLATGGSLAAVVLGHWYLVTPRISEQPLILQARLLLGVIGLQVLLFIVWTTLGGGPGQAAWSAFSSANILLVVLRLLVSLAFPVVLVWMSWRTALTRSMESATGLLYINLAAVMAGTIGAAALYVSGGLLV